MAQTFTSTDVVTTTNVFGDNQSQRVNENTLRSNFSGTSQPNDPVVGQAWYDTTNSKQMQYNGTAWVPIDTNGATQVDVSNAKGNLTTLTSYLRVAHNDDGTLKSSPATAIDEFKDNALVITYVSASSFTVPMDLTSIFTSNRKLKVYLESSTAITYVSSSSYNGGANVTTVVIGGTVLDSSVTSVKYSIIQYGERQDTIHQSDMTSYAPIASPALTGVPTAPTAAIGTSTDQLATTEFVSSSLGNTAVVADHIASGRKASGTSGLSITVTAGTSVINNKSIPMVSNTVSLPAKKACMLYDKSDGTTGIVTGAYPAAIASTVYRWIIDGTSSILSTVGTNNLSSIGTITQSDGWLGYSALGAGGYYVGASNASIPAYASASSIRIIFKFISNSAIQCFYHDGPRKISCNASNYLMVGGVSTSFVMTSGVTYCVELKSAGNTTAGTVYLDGVNIGSAAFLLNATGTTPYVLANNGAAEKSVSCVEYVELFNASISDDATGLASNTMIFPCFYTDSNNIRRNPITDVLPDNCTFVGFARTNSTIVAEYNLDDYSYGRREKAVGGNRKVFLGWKYFSGVQILSWNNPFGTGKYKVEVHYADDAKGTNEIRCPSAYAVYTVGFFGVNPYSQTTGYNEAQNITLQTTNAGVTSLNGTVKTSGYIGVYAEVMEDYKGVDGQ